MTVSAKAGRYELIEEIGRGAMGIVYRANDPVIGRPVAVKTMRLANTGTGLSHEEMLSRFQTEARAAGRLTHPNIVVVYDAGEEDSVLYITMELVEGPSLQALIEAKQSFPLPRVLRIIEQACSALDFAHQHNIIHRDIKPANLMLTPDDTLKITDFGTAKILQMGTMQTAQAIGTPSYMSPEQIKGRPVDGRTDIFSLGVLLYELVTGQKPFPGDSVTTVIYKIVNEDPVPPRELDSSIHPGLSAVITKALAKRAEQRFQTCREFLEALQNYAKYQEPSADTTLVLPRAAMPNANVESTRMLAARGAAAPKVPSTGRTQHPVLTEPTKANPRSSAWLVVILLAVIGVAGYQVLPALREVWQRSQPDRAAAENALRSAALNPKTAAPATPTAAATPEDTEPSPVANSEEAAPAPATTAPAPEAAKPAPAAASATEGSAGAPESTETALPTNASKAVARPVDAASASKPAPTPAKATSEPPAPTASTGGAAAVPASLNKEATAVPKAAETAPKAASPIPNATPAPYKPTRLPPSPAAEIWQTRIWRMLVQLGIDDQVQVAASGNTITLTGALRLPAHRRLLARLQEVPERIQVVDDIDYADETTPDTTTH